MNRARINKCILTLHQSDIERFGMPNIWKLLLWIAVGVLCDSISSVSLLYSYPNWWTFKIIILLKYIFTAAERGRTHKHPRGHLKRDLCTIIYSYAFNVHSLFCVYADERVIVVHRCVQFPPGHGEHHGPTRVHERLWQAHEVRCRWLR